MRARRYLRTLLVLVAVAMLPAISVSAHHGPTAEDVVHVATASPWFMDCSGSSPRCVELPGSSYPSRKAWIQPATGPLTSVTTQVEGVYLDTQYPWHFGEPDQAWAGALLTVGCADAAAVAAFIDKVAALQAPGTSVPAEVVGECSMSGAKISPGTSRVYCVGAKVDCFVVQSDIRPSALPTPTPTAKPTAVPTATPTVNPTAVPTATPRPTPTPTPTATPRVTARPTPRTTAGATPATSTGGSASTSASESAAETATATPNGTPEQSVAGIFFTPTPTEGAPAPAGADSGWAGSVPSVRDVSTDPAALGSSALAALLLLLAMGFIGELFNNTFEANYDRILAWWGTSWMGRIGRAFSGLWGGGR